MTPQEIAIGVVAGSTAAGLGLLVALAVFVLAMVRALGVRTVPITPAMYRDELNRGNAPPARTFPPDLAWPLYFWRQVRTDRQGVQRESQNLWKAMFDLWIGTFLRGRHGDVRRWWFILPLPVLTLAGNITALVALVLFNLVFGALVLACTLILLIPIEVAIGGQRLIESGWGALRGADASCPKCYYVSERPAYQCSGCAALHRDVRPGVRGVFARRCDCGTLLPTMVLRAAWRLTAVCQRCQEPLREGAAALRDIRIPIFGDVSAGKTRYLYAAVDSLFASGRRGAIPISFSDQESRVQGDRALALIRSGQSTIKTTEELPRALSVRIGAGSTATLLHLFDAAGEHFRSASSHDDLGFLATGHGLIYVVDPFAVGAVRDRLVGHAAAAQDLATAADGDPETAYGQVVSRLRSGGIKPRSQRLAVLVSRADLLAGYGLEVPTGSDQISEWLYEAGLHNVVLAARQEFAEVRYFTVASLAASVTTPDTEPGLPLRWLLRSRGLKLPDELGTVTARGGL